MKKLIIGAVAALTAVGLTSSATSAQDGAYDFPAQSTSSATTQCATDGNPTFGWDISFSGALKGAATYRVRFVNPDDTFFGPWISVPAASGSGATFPVVGASYTADGWEPVPDGQLNPGPDIQDLRVVAEVTDTGDGNAVYTQQVGDPGTPPVTLNVTEECVAAQPPPTTTTTLPPPTTTLPPGQLPPPGIEQPPPPAPEEQVLPPTGLSGFDMTMRGAALFLIAGLGFVIVARRRRFATATAGS